MARSLTIDRLACRFHLPSGLADPAAARARLTRLAEREVPAACAAFLDSFQDDDEAVYRIQRLRLELWLDLVGMSEQDMAQRWGRLLAMAVARAVRRGGAQHVVRFDSPRHFVGAFLRDLLDGRAWGRWYYAEFRPLQRLSVGAVAMELLVARPDWIEPLLAELATTGHTERLIEQWRLREIEKVWAGLGFAAQLDGLPLGPETMQTVSWLASLWPGLALSGSPEPTARARDRLRVWLALATSQPETARDLTAARVAHAVVDLAALARADPDVGPTLMMESGLYPAMARRVAASALADALGWLVPVVSTGQGRSLLARLAELVAVGPASWTTEVEVVGELHGPPAQQAPSAPPSPRRITSAALSSPVGSVFLVAPALVEVGLWEHWRDECGDETARRYLFVLALKVLGRDRAPLLLGDRMLAAFAGLEEPPLADARAAPGALAPTLSQGERRETATQRDRAQVGVSAAVPDVAAHWYPARQRDLFVGAAHGVQVLRDAAAACWLAACPVDPDSASAPRLPCRPELAAAVAAARDKLSAEEQEVLAAEARHLQLGQRLGYRWLTPHLDAALSTAASLVLRRTASRLPGFARGTPAYLARQFLAQPASLRRSRDRLEVELSGGPLAAVLHLAELPEALEVPWLSQPLRLSLPGLFGRMR